MISSNRRPARNGLPAPGFRLPVRIVFFESSTGCDSCEATRQALEQLAGADECVTLETLDLVRDAERAAGYGVNRVPAVIVSVPGSDRIRYYGAPLGNELPTLVNAIRMTSSGETMLSDRSRSQLKMLTAPVVLTTFFTPSCVYCPQMISLANQLSVESPLVSSVAIDATEYPDLVRHYRVNGVPKTIINDKIEIMGVVSEDELVSAILRL
jgi:glutaredoxin-like protein